eukprot:13630371-Alexandrium_andersonii.AAC.1
MSASLVGSEMCIRDSPNRKGGDMPQPKPGDKGHRQEHQARACCKGSPSAQPSDAPTKRSGGVGRQQ